VEHGSGEPLVELVRLHRYAVELAAERGRDADAPWFLSRSVILED
jgi:glutamine---fructose-6-phosphate transaminase (isomerizing)